MMLTSIREIKQEMFILTQRDRKRHDIYLINVNKVNKILTKLDRYLRRVVLARGWLYRTMILHLKECKYPMMGSSRQLDLGHKRMDQHPNRC